MSTRESPPLRKRFALSLGRGLGVLFIAMGLTIAVLSIAVIGPFHRTMRYTDESLKSAERLAQRVKSGVETSSGLIGGVTNSLNETGSALDEMVNLLRQTGSTLERIREIMPPLSADLRSMAGVAGSLLPGNRLRETSDKLNTLHDTTEDLQEEIVVLSDRVVSVGESLDSLTADVTAMDEDVAELETSLGRADQSLSRLSGSFSPSRVTAVFLWGSLLLAALMVLTGVFLLLKLGEPEPGRSPGEEISHSKPGKAVRRRGR